HLTAEHAYTVPPLSLPDACTPSNPESLSQYDAVRLFVNRAQAAERTFTVSTENAAVIAAICRGLDGLPLAIELAVPRLRLFSPQELLERLTRRLELLTHGFRDLPERQRTLRNTIDWSYQLLGERERVLFARLSVFVRG